MIPPAAWGFLLRWGAVFAAAAALFAGGWFKGSERVQARWDADKQAQANAAEDARLKAQATIDDLSRRLAAKQSTVKKAEETNLAKVEQYAPPTFPPLPGSFRLLHDAAAAGEEAPDPAGTDAASVSLKATAATVTANYSACLYDQSRLTELQEVVRTLTGE